MRKAVASAALVFTLSTFGAGTAAYAQTGGATQVAQAETDDEDDGGKLGLLGLLGLGGLAGLLRRDRDHGNNRSR